jgi:hypothetical protein
MYFSYDVFLHDLLSLLFSCVGDYLLQNQTEDASGNLIFNYLERKERAKLKEIIEPHTSFPYQFSIFS